MTAEEKAIHDFAHGFSTPFWIRDAALEALRRDPVDAASALEALTVLVATWAAATYDPPEPAAYIATVPPSIASRGVLTYDEDEAREIAESWQRDGHPTRVIPLYARTER